MAKRLSVIFRSSLENGIFPDIRELLGVTPKFKSVAKSDVNNFRPISVISIFTRILERIVQDQVFDFILANKIVTKKLSALVDYIPRKHP